MTIRSALLAVITACGMAAGAAQAQTWPAKTVTLIVPAAPGGVTDRMARILAPELTAAWGQQVIVENKPGANNQIAAEYVARSAPDGTTILLSPEGTFSVNPYLYAKLPYDAERDFAPITGLFSIYQALVAHPSLAANTVPELIALAKGKPGALNYGTFGLGSSGHLNMEMFSKMTGTKLTAVHYKGAAPALNDVIAGHIQMLFVAVGSAAPQVAAGKVKFLGIGSPKRLAKLPNVATVAEPVPGFEAASWFGLFAPAKTPQTIVAKISADVRTIFEKPEIKKFLDTQSFEAMTGTPDAFEAFVKAEAAKWSKVVREAGVTIN
jgi:tripartite-type tricarboxylate transporter receptor subunit TctC